MPEAATPAPTFSILSQQVIEGNYVVTIKAVVGKRSDVDIGAVKIDGPDSIMRAMTLAKERVMASILGKPTEPVAESTSVPTGSPAATPTPTPAAEAVTLKDVTDRLVQEHAVEQLVKDLGITEARFKSGLKGSYGKTALGDITDAELAELTKRLTDKKNAGAAKS